ncbi:MAG: hypothetical protein Fues2KO_41530 [Fuerstiella sp.]
MRAERDHCLRRSIAAGTTAGFAALLSLLFSWQVFEFDAALFVYAQTLVISVAVTVYRLTVWLHRPPTAQMFRTAVRVLKNSFHSNGRMRLLKVVGRRAAGYFLANRFVLRRGVRRWSVHWPIMVGCISSVAIVVPLIAGWVWFETVPGDLQTYRLMNFGVPVLDFAVNGPIAFVLFHGLVWAAFPVVIGCGIALRRRSHDRGDQAVQSFENDLLPLLLLLAVSLTGLWLTVSYSFFDGASHQAAAAIHLVTVCGTLLWLPYSKLFHIPQRSLKLAQMVCDVAWQDDDRVACVGCGEEFASRGQVNDLIEVQHRLGYSYSDPASDDHFQLVCPRCRRRNYVVAQSTRCRAAVEELPAVAFPVAEPLAASAP